MGGWLPAGFSSLKIGLIIRAIHVKSAVGKVAVGQVFFRALGFILSGKPRVIHIHSSAFRRVEVESIRSLRFTET
jgi:hypothetical protein